MPATSRAPRSAEAGFPRFGLALATRLDGSDGLALLRATPELRTVWLIVLAGTASWDDGRQRRWLDAGCVVSCRPGELAPGRFARMDRAFAGILLGFSGDVAWAHARFLERRFGAVQRVESAGPVLRLARTIVREAAVATNELARERIAARWFGDWHHYVLRHRRSLIEFCSRSPAVEDLDPLPTRTVKDLARALGYSRSYLTRLLARRWGQTPGELLHQLRLQRAAQLLRTTGMPVEHVAAQSGFESASGFFAAFRARFAATPGEFRRRRRDDAALPAPPARRPPEPPPPALPALGHSTPLHDQIDTSDWDGPYFQILTCGEINRPNARPFEMSLNAMISRRTIVITLAGEATFETPEAGFHVGAGLGVAYPTPLNGRWRTAPDCRQWHRIWLQFTGPLAERFFDAAVARHGHVAEIPADSPLIAHARRMMRWIRGPRRTPIFWSQQTYLWLLAWREHLERAQRPPVDLRLAQFQSRLFDHRQRTLRAYARHLGYSVSYLSSKLKSQWNVAPGIVLRTARLDHGARLLRSSQRSVATIARECGYRTPSAFILAFKKRTGLTPLVYRRRHRV